jgi:ankyrin repeat protein
MTTRRAALALLGSLLIAAGAKPALAASPSQLADFFRAVQIDDARTVQSLLNKGVNPNALNPVGGEPALVLALREGSMRVADVLVAHPAIKVDAPAVNGNTALMMAAFKKNLLAVQALVSRGAAVSRRPGWTPLHYAAASGDVDIARYLIEHGAEVDAVSPPASGRYTPLMMAAREGQEAAALFLLRQGANPSLTNSEGLNAAQIAQRANQASIAAAIGAQPPHGLK